MRKFAALLLIAITLPLAACGDDNKSPTAPSSTTNTTTAANPAPAPAPAFSYDRGVEMLFGSTQTGTFSARATGNMEAMVGAPFSPFGDFNNAECDMYVYNAAGGRRKWTTPCRTSNEYYNGRATTIWKNVTTDNAIRTVFQFYKRGSDVPVPATFPNRDTTYLRLSPNISVRNNSTDGLVYLQGPMPAVSSTFNLNERMFSSANVQMVDDGPSAVLTEVAEMIDGALTVICKTEQSCRPFRQ